MSGARKFQAEVDKVLKKVEEGIALFDSLEHNINYVYDPLSTNRAKAEDELKKEIKKLQKSRDEIKKWMNNSEAKLKMDQLEEAKLAIERRMGNFKVIERETKTKAYSRDGLSKDGPMSAEEKRNIHYRERIIQCIDALSSQVDSFRGELDALDESSAVTSRRGRDSTGSAEELLDSFIEWHTYHIKKLEEVLDVLERNGVSYDELDNILDMLGYYLEETEKHSPDVQPYYEIYDQVDFSDPEARSDSENSPIAEESAPAVVPLSSAATDPVSSPKAVTPAKPAASTLAATAAAAVASVAMAATISTSATIPAPPLKPLAKDVLPKMTAEVLDASGAKSQEPFRPAPISRPTMPLSERLALLRTQQTTELPDSGKPPAWTPLSVTNLKYNAATLFSDLSHIPEYDDELKSRVYVPKQLYNVETPYPTEIAPILENPICTGTLAQAHAAHLLKQRSWTFHKGFSQWFLRTEPPSKVTDTYEIGNYLVFDHEKSWTERHKKDFQFDYIHLDNEPLSNF